jgi:hypothetical protein
MAGIFADHHHPAFTADDLAFFTDGFYRWPYFHFPLRPSLAKSRFAAPRDAAAGQVVRRQFDGHPVAGQYPDEIHPQFARDVRQNLMPVGKLYLKHGIRIRIRYYTFYFDDISFGQNLTP